MCKISATVLRVVRHYASSWGKPGILMLALILLGAWYPSLCNADEADKEETEKPKTPEIAFDDYKKLPCDELQDMVNILRGQLSTIYAFYATTREKECCNLAMFESIKGELENGWKESVHSIFASGVFARHALEIGLTVEERVLLTAQGLKDLSGVRHLLHKATHGLVHSPLSVAFVGLHLVLEAIEAADKALQRMRNGDKWTYQAMIQDNDLTSKFHDLGNRLVYAANAMKEHQPEQCTDALKAAASSCDYCFGEVCSKCVIALGKHHQAKTPISSALGFGYQAICDYFKLRMLSPAEAKEPDAIPPYPDPPSYARKGSFDLDSIFETKLITRCDDNVETLNQLASAYPDEKNNPQFVPKRKAISENQYFISESCRLQICDKCVEEKMKGEAWSLLLGHHVCRWKFGREYTSYRMGKLREAEEKQKKEEEAKKEEEEAKAQQAHEEAQRQQELALKAERQSKKSPERLSREKALGITQENEGQLTCQCIARCEDLKGDDRADDSALGRPAIATGNDDRSLEFCEKQDKGARPEWARNICNGSQPRNMRCRLWNKKLPLSSLNAQKKATCPKSDEGIILAESTNLFEAVSILWACKEEGVVASLCWKDGATRGLYWEPALRNEAIKGHLNGWRYECWDIDGRTVLRSQTYAPIRRSDGRSLITMSPPLYVYRHSYMGSDNPLFSSADDTFRIAEMRALKTLPPPPKDKEALEKWEKEKEDLVRAFESDIFLEWQARGKGSPHATPKSLAVEVPK